MRVATSKEILFEGIAIHNKCICVCVCPLKIGFPLQIYDTFFVNLTVRLFRLFMFAYICLHVHMYILVYTYVYAYTKHDFNAKSIKRICTYNANIYM